MTLSISTSSTARQTAIVSIRFLSIYLYLSVIIEENQCEMMTPSMESLVKGVFFMTADNLTFSLEIDFIPDIQEGRSEFKKKMKEVADKHEGTYILDPKGRPIISGLAKDDVEDTLKDLGLLAFGSWPWGRRPVLRWPRSRTAGYFFYQDHRKSGHRSGYSGWCLSFSSHLNQIKSVSARRRGR